MLHNSKNTNYKTFLAWGIFIILALLWGSSFILIKRGLDVFDPLQVTSIRINVAFVVFFLLTLYFGKLKQLPFKYWKYLIIIGLCANLIPGIVFPLAETQVDSSIVAMLNSMTPIFTFILAYLGFNYQAKTKQIIGMTLAVVGSISFAFIDYTGFTTFKPFTLITLIGCIGYAISTLVAKHYLKDINPFFISNTAIFLISPITLIHLFSTDFIFQIQTTEGLKAFGYLAILGAFGTVVAMTLYQLLLKMVSPVFATSVTYLIPVVALGWGMLDGEKIVTLHLISISLILVGVYLTKN